MTAWISSVLGNEKAQSESVFLARSPKPKTHGNWQSFPLNKLGIGCLWMLAVCAKKVVTAAFSFWMITASDCSLMDTLY